MLKPIIFHSVYIGIDPGINNGLAIYKKKKNLLILKSVKFWDLIREINLLIKNKYTEPPFFILENPDMISPTFDRGKDLSQAVLNKISQDVGKNKMVAVLLIEYFEMCKVDYKIFRPTKKSPKWNRRKFTNITNLDTSTNQHSRDAAKLLYEFDI